MNCTTFIIASKPPLHAFACDRLESSWLSLFPAPAALPQLRQSRVLALGLSQTGAERRGAELCRGGLCARIDRDGLRCSPKLHRGCLIQLFRRGLDEVIVIDFFF